MHTVAIVGRPNVGKSALFNRLTGKQISIVFDRPGVTRDRIVTTCDFDGHPVELIDTGGLGLEDSEGFGSAIAHEVDIALSTAETILFVMDGREGVTPLDLEVAKKLRRQKSRVLLVVNKVDEPKLNHLADAFHRVGFGDPFPVSAAHGVGVSYLIEQLTAPWGKAAEVSEDAVRAPRPMRLSILGRPNVGKSSLINALLQNNRAIVSSVPGTTRDNVDVPFTWDGQPYTLIDTAGMRQERRIKDELETKMSGRSAHAVNRADLCVLVLDIMVGAGLQEKKIGGLIQEAHRPCIILCNKWDLAKEQGDVSQKTKEQFLEVLHRNLFFLDYAPVLFASAKTGEKVMDLMKQIGKINENRLRRVPTAQLNEVLHRLVERQLPPSHANRRFKIYYATQQFDAEKPPATPTFVVFVNDMRLLTNAYRRYLEIHLRKEIDFTGCPIHWIWREKKGENKK